MSATIGSVSEALRNVLEAQMTPGTKVTLLSPGDASSLQTRINLFLFRVVRNPQLNTRDRQPKPGDPTRLVFPPLALNLFYLLTPFAPLDPQTGLADTHGIMGEAMRVLYENAIVPQSFLPSGLTQGEVKVTLAGNDVEELSKIWTALTKEYRLSAVYEVSYIDIPAKQEVPMAKRVVKTQAGATTAKLPPIVGAMQPLSAKTGDTIQFTGSNLAGWQATVRVGGKSAATDMPLSDTSAFTVKVPTGLQAGLYEVEVDVSHLTRFQSFLEVQA
jgi:hypothetical protein